MIALTANLEASLQEFNDPVAEPRNRKYSERTFSRPIIECPPGEAEPLVARMIWVRARGSLMNRCFAALRATHDGR
jgi:hypothetical protein